ncbi:hypothetical protein QBC35DRAFT_502805 [Podospora australis]|uniref:BHLH domain-containing protein n=1 Tax=Podospora australis TaxID=1536484 RepID=A0AAN6WPU9_9PEZI|nr:hypothetical protein QBC35DRAFT_502805 [Podospora australis]
MTPPTSSTLPRNSPGLGASNGGDNDVELFLRLLRVVRRLDAQDNSILGSFDASSSQPPRRDGKGSSRQRRAQGTKRQRKARQVIPSEDDDFDEDDDLDDLDEETDDDEDEDEEYYEEDEDHYDQGEGESSIEDKLARDLTIHVATSSSSSDSRSANGKSTASKRKSRHSQRKSITKPPATRSQRRQQQEQQQQQSQQHQRQRKKPEEQLQQQPQRHHAVVEKRYRSVINSKIQQLSELIPPTHTFSTSGLPQDQQERHDQDANSKGLAKADTKSAVLDRALQYLNHLVSTYQQYENEREDLRRKIQLFVGDVAPQAPSGSAQVTV